MTRRRGVAIALLAVVTASCQWFPVRRPVVQYYTDPQAVFLVPVTRMLAIPDAMHDPEGALQADLDQLLAAVPKGLQSPFSPGTQVEVTAASGGDASVTLKLPVSEGSGGESLLAGALVRTATALPGIHRVILSLEDMAGAPLSSEHLDLTAPLSPNDPGMQNVWLPDGHEGLLVTVYYRVPDSPYLVPVKLPISPTEAAAPTTAELRLLSEGPPPGLRFSVARSLPEGASLTMLGWDGHGKSTAEVRWSGPSSALGERALALTLTEQPEIRTVVIEGLPSSSSLARPSQVNGPL